MPINPKDYECEVNIIWDGKTGGEANIKSWNVKFDTPSEFGGLARYPCPDELFISAIGGCLLTTFLYFNERIKLNLIGFKIMVKGKVSLIGQEGYRLTHIEVIMKVEVSEEKSERVEKCVELTKKYCHILRSIEQCVPIEIKTQIVSAVK